MVKVTLAGTDERLVNELDGVGGTCDAVSAETRVATSRSNETGRIGSMSRVARSSRKTIIAERKMRRMLRLRGCKENKFIWSKAQWMALAVNERSGQ